MLLGGDGGLLLWVVVLPVVLECFLYYMRDVLTGPQESPVGVIRDDD